MTEAKCSFCGKSEGAAFLLIKSSQGEIYICDDCVDLCNEIVLSRRDGNDPGDEDDVGEGYKWCFED